METFFVTGAMGFVGSHWCEYLLKKGKKVYGLDFGVKYKQLLEYENFVFFQDTIKNYELMQTLINRSDVICHFAGIAEPDQYVDSPRKVIDVTAVAGLRLVDMCRGSGKLFFYTSTSEIYGKNTNIPFQEDDDRVLGSTATNRWCYSTSKAVVEHYLRANAQTKELESVIVRLFNVYGPRLSGRAVSNFIAKAVKGDDIVIHGDGSQTRSFTYIDDVIEGFYSLVTSKNAYNNAYNIGNPVETSIKSLAEAVVKAAPNDVALSYMEHEEYYGASYEDINRRVPDITRITDTVGWKPTTSLEDGVKAMMDYYFQSENE